MIMARMNLTDHHRERENQTPQEPDTINRESVAAWLVTAVIIVAAVVAFVSAVVLLTGCSVAKFGETYSGGEIEKREVSSINFLTWIKSSFAANQTDGAYDLLMGTEGGVDPAVEKGLATIGNAFLAGYGMHALRTARPDSAFAPVSVDSLGGGAFGASAITAEQQAAMADNNARRVEIAKVKAENERLQAELEEARGEAEAAHAEAEAARNQQPIIIQQGAPLATGGAN